MPVKLQKVVQPSGNTDSRMSSAPTSARPQFVTVASGKGGVGKSTLATLIADLWTLAGLSYCPFQVDDQRRLEAMLGARVATIVPDYEAAMRAPRALTGPFAPLYDACAAAPRTGASVLLDVGANRVELAALWARKAELQEDLSAWSMPALVLVPALVESESLRQAAGTIRAFAGALPEATIAFVENQRDGRLSDLKPRSGAVTVWRSELAPLLDGPGRHHLTMPLIEADAWSAYENHALRFIKAMSLAPVEAAALLGEEISEAKIMRSAVTAFVRTMRAELAPLLSGVVAPGDA
ncbi:hypothetical protein [Methylobacterium sp. V23]|uniref:nucleotide-binding protein n=1 Tax=Methylobacterium sp. V23 TaxID=2044878 RepID=UPI0011B01C3E|nr:hypothetical protein [Methylobacterium sp. V23]